MRAAFAIFVGFALLQEADTGATIEGVVTRRTTGKPEANIIVSLRYYSGGPRNESTVTDESGRFSFRNVSPGDVRISPGDPNRNGEFGSVFVTADSGQRIQDVRLLIADSTVVSGSISIFPSRWDTFG